jgi:hypothetical protein
MTEGPRFVVTLRPVRDPVHPHRERPVSIRLRAFLKVALRAFGLRAVDVREIPPAAPADGKTGDQR